MKMPEIIGLSGTLASGKDTMADYLVKNFNYHHISTGDMIRKIARERYGSVERPILQQTGNELRAEGGPGVLAEKALAEFYRPIIISGIRAVGEAQAVKNAGGVMIFVDADQYKRYERMKKRARDQESKISFEDFQAREVKELSSTSESGQNLNAVEDIADIIIDNSSSREDFYVQLDSILGGK